MAQRHYSTPEANKRAHDKQKAQNYFAKTTYPETYDEYVKAHPATVHVGRFSPQYWLDGGGTQEQIDAIKVKAQSGTAVVEPLKIFGCEIAKSTKFGSRPGPRGARQSGLNPTAKGRENELTAIDVLRQRNPLFIFKDVAEEKEQKGGDIEVWDGDKQLALIDSSTDKVLQKNEYQAMKDLAETGIGYYIFLADNQKLLPITPDTPYEIGSYRF